MSAETALKFLFADSKTLQILLELKFCWIGNILEIISADYCTVYSSGLAVLYLSHR